MRAQREILLRREGKQERGTRDVVAEGYRKLNSDSVPHHRPLLQWQRGNITKTNLHINYYKISVVHEKSIRKTEMKRTLSEKCIGSQLLSRNSLCDCTWYTKTNGYFIAENINEGLFEHKPSLHIKHTHIYNMMVGLAHFEREREINSSMSLNNISYYGTLDTFVSCSTHYKLQLTFTLVFNAKTRFNTAP